jgi:hypothetical protein
MKGLNTLGIGCILANIIFLNGEDMKCCVAVIDRLPCGHILRQEDWLH